MPKRRFSNFFTAATNMESDTSMNDASPIDAPSADTTTTDTQAQAQVEHNSGNDVFTTVTMIKVVDLSSSSEELSPGGSTNPLVAVHRPAMHAEFPASDSDKSFRIVNETETSAKRKRTLPTPDFSGVESPGSELPSIEESGASRSKLPMDLTDQSLMHGRMSRKAPIQPSITISSSNSSFDSRSDDLQFINLPPRFPANAGLDYPRLVDLSTWSNKVDISQFSMADGIATLLWQLNRATMTEFFDFHRVLRLRGTWLNEDGQPDLIISRVARRVTVGVANKNGAELTLSLKYDIHADGKWVLCAGRSRAEGIDENDREGLKVWCFTMATGFLENRLWEDGVWKKNGFEFVPRQERVRMRRWRPGLERKKAHDNLNLPTVRYKDADIPSFNDIRLSPPTMDVEDNIDKIYDQSLAFLEQVDVLKALSAMQNGRNEEREGG